MFHAHKYHTTLPQELWDTFVGIWLARRITLGLIISPFWALNFLVLIQAPGGPHASNTQVREYWITLWGVWF